MRRTYSRSPVATLVRDGRLERRGWYLRDSADDQPAKSARRRYFLKSQQLFQERMAELLNYERPLTSGEEEELRSLLDVLIQVKRSLS